MAPTMMRRALSRQRGPRVVARAQSAQQKRALITGGNTGIGFETAKALLLKGYAVDFTSRSDEKAASAIAKLKAAVPGAAVEALPLELADLASVRSLASRITDEGRTYDVLLNNAGVMACPEMQTSDGFEYQLGVNHLGHFLFTLLLLPQLQQQQTPVRIINVSSSAHSFGRINFNDLMGRKAYQTWAAYGQSKLANVLFTYELARRLPPSSGITVNALHPGVVRTELSRYMVADVDAWYMKPVTEVFKLFTLSPEQGAATSIHLASSPEVEGLSSKYFSSCRPVASSAASYDPDTARKLWEVSLELTNAPADVAAPAPVVQATV